MAIGRVLIVTTEYPPYSSGGLGTHLRWLARGLCEQGVRVDIVLGSLGIRGEPSISNDVEWNDQGATILRVAPSSTTLALQTTDPRYLQSYGEDLARAGLARLRDQHGDGEAIVHAHDWFNFGAARSVADTAGCALVTSVHLLYHPTYAFWGQKLTPAIIEKERKACVGSDALITVSHSMAALLEDNHGVPRDRIHVVHNGMDFGPSVARHGASHGDGPRIVFAGRLTRQKGILELLASALHVFAEHPTARYAIAGEQADFIPDSLLKRDIEAALAKCGEHRSRIEWLGMVPSERMPDLLAGAALVVIPSLYEPFGYVAIEAMAAGVPVVATAAGGLAEIIEHERTGLLVPVRKTDKGRHQIDAAELSSAQLRVLQDPALGERLAEAARPSACERFSVAAMTKRTLEVYDAVAARFRDELTRGLEHGDPERPE
jgi:glycosyltransferase involved in cell wall biosynthesis